jgi:cell division protein FtsN
MPYRTGFMARDYKPAARTKTAPASGSGSSLLVGILIGLLLGLGIALGVAVYLNRVPIPFLSRGKPGEAPALTKPENSQARPASRTQESSPRDERPRFDFYSILPGTDDAGRAKPQTEDKGRSAPQPKEIFYLQAGAFQTMADADNMKARLALLGVEATIQSSATSDRGALHRVRVGPFTRVEQVNRTRETLKQNGIESALIKARETPN